MVNFSLYIFLKKLIQIVSCAGVFGSLRFNICLLWFSCYRVWLLGDPMDCSPPCSSVHGISEARILKWVTIAFSSGSSWPRDWTFVPCLAGRFISTEPRGKPSESLASQETCACVLLEILRSVVKETLFLTGLSKMRVPTHWQRISETLDLPTCLYSQL